MAAVLCDLEGTLTGTCWIRSSRTLEMQTFNKVTQKTKYLQDGSKTRGYIINISKRTKKRWQYRRVELLNKICFQWVVRQTGPRQNEMKWNGTERIEIKQYVQLKYSSSTVGETNIIVIILWYWFSLFVWSIYNVQQPRIGLSST